MAEDCVFCKIAASEIPVNFAYQDDEVVAFPDMNPQAPTHLLVIPRKHFADLTQLGKDGSALIGRIFAVIGRLASEKGLLPDGFRVVCNTGPKSGQTVKHLHFHVLGGRYMGWPPG